MPHFKIRALDVNDNLVESVIKASDIDDAKVVALEKSFTIIKIEETKAVDDLGASLGLFNTIKLKDIIVFCRQMAIIIKSGVNITLGLDILKKQSSEKFKKAVVQVNAEVQKGRTLSQAMKETDQKFPDLLIRMIATGETSGNIDSVLDNMGDYYERENYINSKLISAVIYPAILVVTAIIMVIFFAQFILPSISELMEGQAVPLLTTIVLCIVKGLVSIYTVGVIITVIIALIVVKKIVPAEKYRKTRDTILLKIPIVGSVIKDVITVRFLNTLYLLMKSGMDIVNVLEIIKKIVSNYLAEIAIDTALEGIKRGEKLGETLEKADFFEPLAIQMISVGEETGELEKVLNEVSVFYENRLEQKIEKLVSMIEPVFTLVIGVTIGILILAMALPMFSMVGNMDQIGYGGIE